MGIDWNGSTVLVTGATGIVGSALCHGLLERGTRVVALIRDHDPQTELFRRGDVDRVQVVSGSLEDYPTVERSILEHEVETIFHLGAQTIVGTAQRSPLQTFKSNIEGSWNLLEACRIAGDQVRAVIVASSDKAYGDQPDLPYHEDMPLLACHPYDVSKSCTDMLAKTYAESYALPTIVARCGNIYGGGDLNWSRIVPGTIRSILRGERPIVRSDGQYVRDYLYVEDAVDAYLRLAEAVVEREDLRGEAFNFSTESWVTVLEIVEAITRAMGSDLVPDIRNEARGEIKSQSLSAAKAHRELGWKAAFDLEAGLRETVTWYRAYLEAS